MRAFFCCWRPDITLYMVFAFASEVWNFCHEKNARAGAGWKEAGMDDTQTSADGRSLVVE